MTSLKRKWNLIDFPLFSFINELCIVRVYAIFVIFPHWLTKWENFFLSLSLLIPSVAFVFHDVMMWWENTSISPIPSGVVIVLVKQNEKGKLLPNDTYTEKKYEKNFFFVKRLEQFLCFCIQRRRELRPGENHEHFYVHMTSYWNIDSKFSSWKFHSNELVGDGKPASEGTNSCLFIEILSPTSPNCFNFLRFLSTLGLKPSCLFISLFLLIFTRFSRMYKNIFFISESTDCASLLLFLYKKISFCQIYLANKFHERDKKEDNFIFFSFHSRNEMIVTFIGLSNRTLLVNRKQHKAKQRSRKQVACSQQMVLDRLSWGYRAVHFAINNPAFLAILASKFFSFFFVFFLNVIFHN